MRANDGDADRIRATVAFFERRGCKVTFENLGNLNGGCRLDLSKSSIDDDELRRINLIPKISALILFDTKLTERGLLSIRPDMWDGLHDLRTGQVRVGPLLLARISSMRAIDTLYVNDAGLVDEDLGRLKNLLNLTWLSLKGNKLTDSGLECLKILTKLGFLDITATHATDVFLGTITKSYKVLQILELAGTQVTDEGFRSIGELVFLHDLNLGDTAVTDKCADFLVKLPELDTLVLSRTAIGDGLMRKIANKTKMARLYLDGTKVTGGGLENLKMLSGLRVLNLSSTGIRNADLKSLAGLSNLEELYLDETVVTDGCFSHLMNLPALRLITFKGTLITRAAFMRFQEERRRGGK
jgi:hypothetical protein